MSRRKSKKTGAEVVSAIVVLLIVVYVVFFSRNVNNTATQSNVAYTSAGVVDEVNIENDKLNILFLYVGQADCTLVKLNDKTMLIDAGNNEDGKNVSNYLKSLNINKLDYVIGTHSDEDHIGGLDDVITDLDVDKVYMPTVGSDKINYKNIVKAAEKKGLEVQTPKEGDTFSISDANCEVLSVMNEEGVSSNNSSIVVEMKYVDTTYLFMGDAEKEVENSKQWNKADVLKVGHHGSSTSSTQKFLDQVKPHYAIIEVGKENSYRLPNRYTIERLEKVGATILRTDTNCSSFWLTSNGTEIEQKEIKVDLDGKKEETTKKGDWWT